MDTNTIILVIFYALIFVFIYRILITRKKREEITLKDLYRTSKSQEMSIAKSRERIKREKEEFIQYESNKKIVTNDTSNDFKLELIKVKNKALNKITVNEHENNRSHSMGKVSNKSDPIEYPVQLQEELTRTNLNNVDQLLEAARTSGYKFNDKSIDFIDGIGTSYKERLGEIGISTISDLVSMSRDDAGLKQLNETTGIYSKLLKKWYVKADLLRIQGIRTDQIEKLIQIGITSTNMLAKTVPEELHNKFLDRFSYSETPTPSMIRRWIRISKELEIIDNLANDT